jgi:internalin A
MGPLYRRVLTDDLGMSAHFGDPFRPLERECKVIQFHQPLTPVQLERAGELVADRPDVQLYVYFDPTRDLNFLRYFPKLRRLHIALYKLEDVSGFSAVAGNLEELTFGKTKRTFSLRCLEPMKQLRSLFLVGHKKDIAVVSGRTGLTNLGLSGITLPNLSLLLPLQALRSFQLFLGGTVNLSHLSRLPALDDLALMRITKLSDLGILADLVGLTKLKLDWMRNVTSLPSLARHPRLEDVTLNTMKGLTDLSPVAAAPALCELMIDGMPQLTAENFRCLVGHARLKELWLYTPRVKVRAAVEQMLPGIVRR